LKRVFFRFFVFLVLSNSVFASTPHKVTGRLLKHNSSVPANGSITFVAYITSRPYEVQTHENKGNGFSDGYWHINLENFLTSWSAGNVLRVEFTNLSTGMRDSFNWAITSMDPDVTPDVLLSATVPGDYGTINEAISGVSPGATINLIAGHTYTENVLVNKSVTINGVDATTLINPHKLSLIC
jgi:hypothetical protein